MPDNVSLKTNTIFRCQKSQYTLLEIAVESIIPLLAAKHEHI